MIRATGGLDVQGSIPAAVVSFVLGLGLMHLVAPLIQQAPGLHESVKNHLIGLSPLIMPLAYFGLRNVLDKGGGAVGAIVARGLIAAACLFAWSQLVSLLAVSAVAAAYGADNLQAPSLHALDLSTIILALPLSAFGAALAGAWLRMQFNGWLGSTLTMILGYLITNVALGLAYTPEVAAEFLESLTDPSQWISSVASIAVLMLVLLVSAAVGAGIIAAAESQIFKFQRRQ